MPLVDFDRVWSDDDVYELIGLTSAEREAIDAIIPDYYGRKKVGDQPVTGTTE